MASVGRTGRGPWLAVALVVALAGCASNPERTPLPASATGDRSQDFLAMGDRAAAAGELTTAAAFYQRAAGPMGDNVAALIRLGEVYLRDRRWPEAADVLARALRLDGSQLAARRGYARALIAMGQPASALAHLEELLRATPDDVRALNLAGVAQDMIGKPDEAEATYRRALALAPGDPRLEGNLALSRALAGDHETAIATLERLAARPDATPRTRQNLAVAYALAGDLAAARRTALLDLDPASVERNMAFVVQLRDGGRSEAARALLSANGAGQGKSDAGGAGRARAAAADAPLPLVPEAGASEPPAAMEGAATRAAGRKMRVASAPAPDESVATPRAEATAEKPDLAAETRPEPAPDPAAEGSPAVAVADGAGPPSGMRAMAEPSPAPDGQEALPVAPIVLPVAAASAGAQVAMPAEPVPDVPQGLARRAEPTLQHAARPAEGTSDLLATTPRPTPAAGEVGAAAPLPVAPIVLADGADIPGRSPAEEPSAASSSLGAGDPSPAMIDPVPAAGADPAAGANAAAASWLVRLGTFPDAGAALAEWRSLKARHGDVLSGLTRLGHATAGAQALMAGPVPDEATADSLCRRLAARGVSCTTQRI